MPAVFACPDIPTLEQFLLGRVTGMDADRLEEHLEACSRCAQVLRSLRAEDMLVRAMRGAHDTEVPPQQELIEAALPLLKAMRPGGETTTLPPVAAATDGGDPFATTPLLDFLAPPQGPGEIGRLGSYRVLKLLGAGGMGMVFLADDPRLKRQVALKVIRPGLVARADVRERFLREAQAVAAIEHDNIVAIFQVDEDRGVPFLAMPLLRGESLEERLARAAAPLPVDEVLRLGREIAEGLAAAHDRGLVHRDIKPGNIFLSVVSGPASVAQTGEQRTKVKILDFGLARALEGGDANVSGAPNSGGPNLTQTGAITGTPAYMAPEQAQAQPLDGRADLFSLGCVLYRMATGRPPFQSSDVINTLLKVVSEQPPAPRELNSEVPLALNDLIARLMAKRPADRLPTAHAVVEAFQAIEESRRPKLSRRRWLLGSAAAALAAAGLAAWGVHHWLPASVPPEDPGEVTFNYDEADGRMALRLPDEDERVVDLKREKTLSLPPGDYALRPVTPGDKRFAWPGHVLVKSGEKQAVAVRLIGLVREQRAHGLPVRGVAVVSPAEGLLVLSVSDDRTLVAWKPNTADKPRTLWHRDSPLRCLTLAADGRTAATGSGDVGPRAVQTIRFWDLDRLELRPGDLTCRSQVNALAYAPDGKWLLSGENDGTLLLWDVRARVVEVEQKAHGGLGVYAVAFLPDSKHVLTAGGDGAVVLRTTADLEPVRTLPGHTKPVRGLAVMPGGKTAVTGGLDATLRVWDLAAGTDRTWTTPAPIQALAVSPDGACLLTGDAAGAVRLWDLATQAEIVHFDGHGQGVNAVAFTPDGRRAVTGGSDGVVRLWDLPK